MVLYIEVFKINSFLLMSIIIIVFLLLITFRCLSKRKSTIQEKQFIFHVPPFSSCHASTIAENKKSELVCAWFGGKKEGANDVAIWQSTFSKGEWSKPKKVAEAKGIPCWNPVLFTMPDGTMLLFYKVGKNPQQWSGYLKKSHDGAETWGEPILLPAGIIGPANNKPILFNEELLCGSSTESYQRWNCWIDRTSDEGNSWSKSGPINQKGDLFGIIQPTLFVTKKGSIKLLARSREGGFIFSSESFDGGQSWSEAQPTELPNPNSGIDAVKLDDGRLFLIYNHSASKRTPLNIAVSEDDGQSWKMAFTLEDQPGEYSYPSIIQTKDGLVHTTYTWARKHIRHLIIDPKSMKIR